MIFKRMLQPPRRREVLGMDIGPSEAETFWTDFLRKLRRRGLRGVKLVISDAHEGIKAAVSKVLTASWQRCRVGMLKKSTSIGFCDRIWGRRSPRRRNLARRQFVTFTRRPMGLLRGADSQKSAIKRGGEPLQVDCYGRQVGLDLHVGETAPNGACEAVPRLRFAVKAF